MPSRTPADARQEADSENRAVFFYEKNEEGRCTVMVATVFSEETKAVVWPDSEQEAEQIVTHLNAVLDPYNTSAQYKLETKTGEEGCMRGCCRGDRRTEYVTFDTLSAMAEYVAKNEGEDHFWFGDPTFERPLVSAEQETWEKSLKEMQVARAAVMANVREGNAKIDAANKLIAMIGPKQTALDNLRGELTAEAITTRETEIATIRVKAGLAIDEARTLFERISESDRKRWNVRLPRLP
jgi:hypothetical protein